MDYDTLRRSYDRMHELLEDAHLHNGSEMRGGDPQKQFMARCQTLDRLILALDNEIMWKYEITSKGDREGLSWWKVERHLWLDSLRTVDSTGQLVRFLDANFSADGFVDRWQVVVWVELAWMPSKFFVDPLATWISDREREGEGIDWYKMMGVCGRTPTWEALRYREMTRMDAGFEGR